MSKLKNIIIGTAATLGSLVGGQQALQAQQAQQQKEVTQVTSDTLNLHLKGDATDSIPQAIVDNADQYETEIGNKTYGVIREYVEGTDGYNDSVRVGFVVPQIYWINDINENAFARFNEAGLDYDLARFLISKELSLSQEGDDYKIELEKTKQELKEAKNYFGKMQFSAGLGATVKQVGDLFEHKPVGTAGVELPIFTFNEKKEHPMILYGMINANFGQKGESSQQFVGQEVSPFTYVTTQSPQGQITDSTKANRQETNIYDKTNAVNLGSAGLSFSLPVKTNSVDVPCQEEPVEVHRNLRFGIAANLGYKTTNQTRESTDVLYAMPSQTQLVKGSTNSELTEGQPKLTYNGLHLEANMSLSDKFSVGVYGSNLWSGQELINPNFGFKLSYSPGTTINKDKDNQN